MGLHIFDPKIAKTEVAYYLTRMNPYGIPLDSRCDYTKSDWEMWTVMLDDNEEYRNQIIHTMWEALCQYGSQSALPGLVPHRSARRRSASRTGPFRAASSFLC